MSIQQKIGNAFQLLGTEFYLLSALVLTIWLPGSILLVYLRFFVFPETAGGDELRMILQEIRVANLLELAFGPFYVGACLYVAKHFREGKTVSYSESLSYAAKRSFKLLSTRIGTGVIILLGCLAFIVPGIIFALKYALVDAVVVLERREGAQARAMSSVLTEGRRGQIFIAMVLTFLGAMLGIGVMYTMLDFAALQAPFLIFFIINVVGECLSSIILLLPLLVLFEFYWEAKQSMPATLPQT